jgi:hypothetical protein
MKNPQAIAKGNVGQHQGKFSDTSLLLKPLILCFCSEGVVGSRYQHKAIKVCGILQGNICCSVRLHYFFFFNLNENSNPFDLVDVHVGRNLIDNVYPAVACRKQVRGSRSPGSAEAWTSVTTGATIKMSHM